MDMTGIIASAGTAFVGSVGILATYWSGRRQQETAITIAQMQIESHERLAREERHQQRLEKTYEAVLREVDSPNRLSVANLLSHPPSGPPLVVLSACESDLARTLKEEWQEEDDPIRKKELADRLRSQIRRELVGVDQEASMQPYPERN